MNLNYLYYVLNKNNLDKEVDKNAIKNPLINLKMFYSLVFDIITVVKIDNKVNHIQNEEIVH